MMDIAINVMVFGGSALMVYNVISYILYARRVQKKGNWDKEQFILKFPILLLVLFLCGYIAVGIFGQPDIIMAGILLGGSIFVWMILLLIKRITNRIQENEKLEAELMAVEKSNQAKNSFLSSVSHEMRTPMNAIIGIETIIQKNPDLPDDIREQIKNLDISARYLQNLIGNILDMSMFESGEMKLKKEEFSIYDVMIYVNVIIQSRCDSKKLEYKTEVKNDLDDYYVGDYIKVSQILMSVLDNAVKFTSAPGKVSFTAEQSEASDDKRKVRFIISDTGIGISEDFLPHIFDSFAQEDDTITSSYGGSGLGLAVTRKIVELMDGTITVESKKGEGSTFTIEVIFGKSERKAEDTSHDEGSVEAYMEAIRGKKILIVDDIDMNAEILADLLEMEGAESERAVNGQEAVDMFTGHPVNYYDAVMMDLRMPVMDGFEAAKSIRSSGREDALTVPILALTANAFDRDKRRTLESGMNVHLSKPVDADELYIVLGRFIYESHKKEET